MIENLRRDKGPRTLIDPTDVNTHLVTVEEITVTIHACQVDYEVMARESKAKAVFVNILEVNSIDPAHLVFLFCT